MTEQSLREMNQLVDQIVQQEYKNKMLKLKMKKKLVKRKLSSIIEDDESKSEVANQDKVGPENTLKNLDAS